MEVELMAPIGGIRLLILRLVLLLTTQPQTTSSHHFIDA